MPQVDLPDRFRPKPDGIPGHERYVAITNNWQFSREAIAHLRAGLEDALPDGVKTIAIAGSFGRFEASRQSDADCIIVLEDRDDFDVGATT